MSTESLISQANMGRNLPHNLDAEKKVLGIIMMDEDKMYYALEKLNPNDFFDKANAIIFTTIKELAEKNSSVDFLTVGDLLASKGQDSLVGGEHYLDILGRESIHYLGFDSYVEIIAQKSQLRKLIKAAKTIEEEAYSSSDASQVLENAEKLIFDIALNRKQNDFTPIHQVLRELMEDIKNRPLSKDGITGVTTGFSDLNYKFSGFQKSDLIILAARPSMGKTALGLNFAMNAATDPSNPASVAIFSLEMSKAQLAQRMLAAKSTVELTRIKNGDLDDNDFDHISLAMRAYRDSKIFISECPGASIMEIRSQCRKLKAKHGLELVVIDYLQLMSGSGESHQIMVSNISKGLKALAIEMNCPIIALSQLSRKPQERKDHRPMLSDLRDSGSIEQDADIVMFLYREEYYDKENPELKSLAEVIISKHRNGETGTVKLNWIPEWQLFEKNTIEEMYPEDIY